MTRQITLHVAGQPLPNDYHPQDEQSHESLTAGFARRKKAARSRPT